MQILKTSVGRKILMAITGQMMVMFIIIHLIGNTTIFGWISGGINSYAEHLHAFPPIVWAFRLVMLALVTIHIIFGVMLTQENSTATPQAYAVKNNRKATFSSENMIWTGSIIGIFAVYHILHFTARVTGGMVLQQDAMGRFDVFTMLQSSFHSIGIAGIYVVAMVALCLHLYHGIQSFFQTMGWNTDKTLPVISTLGKILAVIFLIGYSTVPVGILTGILSK